MNGLDSAIKTLQLLITVLTLIAIIGPILMGALLWKASKEFATKAELDGYGGRLTSVELGKREEAVKVSVVSTRLDKLESKWETELQYIRRDLDRMADRDGDK